MLDCYSKVFGIIPTLLLLATTFAVTNTASAAPLKDKFPQFKVPGHERELSAITEIYQDTYTRIGNGPGATLWDAWIAAPTLAPGVDREGSLDKNREAWKAALLGRTIDAAGYVSTHQHYSHTQDYGWPFPIWPQAYSETWKPGADIGWHFQDMTGSFMAGFMPTLKVWGLAGEAATKGWVLTNLKSEGIQNDRWQLVSTGKSPVITMGSKYAFDSHSAPFLQIRFSRTPEASKDARCFVQWKREGDKDFSTDRQIQFSPNAPNPWDSKSDMHHCLIEMQKHPLWNGKIVGLRFLLAPDESDVHFGIDSIFTAFDTRQSINNAAYLMGCMDYFNWTGDVDFLRQNMERMRKALQFAQTEFGLPKYGYVHLTWLGHEGRAGYTLKPDGTYDDHLGQGIGDNYWDLLPLGGDEMYSTSYYYNTLEKMANLEQAIKNHPEWKIPAGAIKPFKPEDLKKECSLIKKQVNKHLWDNEKGRFVGCVDLDGVPHDYGFTFLNLEAIRYGTADKDHAKSILDWIDGKRIITGDTSQGPDIYHWRLGPRSTTLRNPDWYFWPWRGNTVPWGDQVQDGGAVFGFSYYDLMARLNMGNPDSAWQRLKGICNWYQDVQNEGGYRSYYAKDPSRGTLQGGGTAGGIGIDHEFVETILMPFTLIDGFLGFRPTADGFELKPNLPKDWPSLTATQLHYRESILEFTAEKDSLVITVNGSTKNPVNIYLQPGEWTETVAENRTQYTKKVHVSAKSPAFPVTLTDGMTIKLDKVK